MQPLGDCFRVRIQISRGIAQQERGKRRVIIDNDPAFAIEDFAARRQNRHIAHPVLLRQLRILAALHDLQPPQPVCQKQENEQYDVLHGGKPERGNFFFAAEHQSSVPASRRSRPSLKSAIPMGPESTGKRCLYSNLPPVLPKILRRKRKFFTRMLVVINGATGVSAVLRAAFGASRWVMSHRGLNLSPPGATIETRRTSYLLLAKESNADSQFHHRVRPRARHSAVCRPATRFHAAGSLFARGGPDRCAKRDRAAFHGIQNSYHRPRGAYSRDLGRW